MDLRAGTAPRVGRSALGVHRFQLLFETTCTGSTTDMTAALTATAPDFGTPAQLIMRLLSRTRTSTDSMPAPFNPRVVGSSPTGPTYSDK